MIQFKLYECTLIRGYYIHIVYYIVQISLLFGAEGTLKLILCPIQFCKLSLSALISSHTINLKRRYSLGSE